MKYGNENVRETAGTENTARQETRQGASYLFQGISKGKT